MPAHRIVIIIAVIIDHKDFIIFDDDCPNTDIDNTFTAADAYIFVMFFSSRYRSPPPVMAVWVP